MANGGRVSESTERAESDRVVANYAGQLNDLRLMIERGASDPRSLEITRKAFSTEPNGAFSPIHCTKEKIQENSVRAQNGPALRGQGDRHEQQLSTF